MRWIVVFAGISCVLTDSAVAVEPTVEVVLLMRGRAPITAAQQWSPILAEAGFRRPTIRNARTGDEFQIVASGTDSRPVYRVFGYLLEDGSVMLPPRARFTTRDVGRLARWVGDLKENGPAESGSPTTAFGLTAQRLELVTADLKQPVRQPTAGADAHELVTLLARQLRYPLTLDPAARRALTADDAVRDELKGVAIGTALAAVFRPAGLVLRPRYNNGRLEYQVLDSRNQGDNWPIGWVATKPPGQLIPRLFDREQTQAVQIPLSAGLTELAKRVGVPFLVDHNALALHRIDPERTMVTMQAGKSHYAAILADLLRQAGLRYDVRTDENDKPLLWITAAR